MNTKTNTLELFNLSKAKSQELFSLTSSFWRQEWSNYLLLPPSQLTFRSQLLGLELQSPSSLETLVATRVMDVDQILHLVTTSLGWKDFLLHFSLMDVIHYPLIQLLE